MIREIDATETALAVQTELRIIFAQKAGALLEALDATVPHDIVRKKSILTSYFSLHESIDALDNDIGSYIQNSVQIPLGDFLDPHHVALILK